MATIDQAATRMEVMAAAMADLTPAMDKTGASALRMYRRAFKQQQSPNGEPWAPVRYRAPPPPTMQLTGSGLKGGGYRVTPQSFVLTYPEHIRFAMVGTKKAPKRNPTPLERDRDKRWHMIPKLAKQHARHVQRHVDKQLMQRGLRMTWQRPPAGEAA